jgi:hydrophobe/amphiphile efflux-1 (HAE1) family protein
MNLPKITVKRPITTMMVFIAVLLFGVYSLFTLPKDMLPELEFPALTVITIYPGAAAEDVEQQITNELEKALAGTENLKSIKSRSAENVSFIFLEFEWGTNISDAANSARDLMALVNRKLPNDAMQPNIMKINSSMIPVVVYVIKARESYSGLERIVEDRIIDPLLKVPGVGSAFIIGQPSREILVELDPKQLQAYNINTSQIATILKAENISIPAGSLNFGRYDFSVRVPGNIESVQQIGNIAVSGIGDKIIRLKDVAIISDGFKEKDEIVYSNELRAVGLFVQKQTGTNTYDVFNDINAKMNQVAKALPPDVELDIVFDSSTVIVEINENLNLTIWYAAIFVMIIVFIFLREWKSSLIVILTIPFAMICAYITMKVMNFTINTFTLISLIVAIGMVVDNAIVVLENIMRHIENGARPKQAAVFGTGEMGNAITASTLTTISVFIPLIFIGGMVGILFRQLALLVAVTMFASLITSLTLTPMVSSLLLKAKTPYDKKPNKLFMLGEHMFSALEKFYKWILKIALKFKFAIIILSMGTFAFVMYLGSTLGTDYIPDLDAGDLIANIEIAVGSNVQETERVAKKVEKIFAEEIPEMISQYTVIGQTESNILTSVGFDEGKNKATISARLNLPQDRNRSASEIAVQIRKKLSEIPEIENYKVTGGSLMQHMLLGGHNPIEIKITGRDFDKLNNTALQIVDIFNENPNLVDIETTIDRGKLEYQVVIDKDKAYSLGLNTALIGMQIRQGIHGAEAGSYNEDGEHYKITVKYLKEHRSTVEDLKNMSLTTMLGKQVKLSDIANITEEFAPLEIPHENQSRIVSVGANLNGISLSEGAAIAQEVIDNLPVEHGVLLSMGGQVTEQEEAFADLNLIFIIGILLVYMTMASQFESFKDPFIILFAIPFSLIGVVIAFFLTGINLNIVSFVGIIMLLGIVVNNGIVLVDYTNLLRLRNLTIFDAIIESGASRLRPVLMTSFTTMLAMIPMVYSEGIGSELWVPLGITVIGGLFVSMLVTLVLIPCIYAVMSIRTYNREKKKLMLELEQNIQ